MHTDPIADLLTRIRNALRAHHEKATIPHSKIKENVVKVLKENNFIEDYKVITEGKFPVLEIALKTDARDLVVKRVSKPGQRIYVKHGSLRPIKSGLGIQIISTSKGVMTSLKAKKANLGGEVLCEVY